MKISFLLGRNLEIPRLRGSLGSFLFGRNEYIPLLEYFLPIRKGEIDMSFWSSSGKMEWRIG